MRTKKPTSQRQDFLGLNKGSHDASICWIHEEEGQAPKVQIFLKERQTRIKRDGYSILPMAKKLQSEMDFAATTTRIAETAIGPRPVDGYEKVSEEQAPFYEMMKAAGLQALSAKTNPKLRFIPHHFAHAFGSVAVSPFEKSLVVVSDGKGSDGKAFAKDDPEILTFPATKFQSADGKASEGMSFYLQDGLNLKCVGKLWYPDLEEDQFGELNPEGLGLFYFWCSCFVFGDGMESGKLMGLAPFGKPEKMGSRLDYVTQLPWSQAYQKKDGDWQKRWSKGIDQVIAATAQQHFEESILQIVTDLHRRFPEYKNLILTGGTALNCVANTKIAKLGLFEKIYVPPFPSDEGISYGLAARMQYEGRFAEWTPKPADSALEYWGPTASVPSAEQIDDEFSDYRRERPAELTERVAELLAEGKILAWFQGRSECGPRALGHRSLLADPKIPGLQDHLNTKVKMREKFRPYGASCPMDEAQTYFDLPSSVESPAMSFTAAIRPEWQQRLMAVSHVDRTSRIQTLRKKQEPLFYELLKAFGRRTGYSVLLNTSLNGKGEPIIETIQEAKRFLEQTPIDGMVVGSHIIFRNKN
jgi:carbamoyltransferase